MATNGLNSMRKGREGRCRPAPALCGLLVALIAILGVPGSVGAQGGIVVQYPGQQPSAQPAQSSGGGGSASGGRAPLKLSFGGELGWRYVAAGPGNIPRDSDTFSMAYHGALRLEVGGQRGGLYSYGRFDGYAPTGRGTFPWSAQARVGYFRNVNYWDPGGLRTSTSTQYTGTSCGYATCYDHYQRRTTSWWEPAGWVNGLRYFYATGYLMDGTQVRTGDTQTQLAGAVGLGFGFVETKFSTWFMETELLYFPERQWENPGRSRWGWYLRGGSLFGPVFVDVTLRLDPAVGGELAVGAGIWLGS